MKLIIDIPEEDYKRMIDESIYSTHTMICAIQNGIPLNSVKAEIIDLPTDMFEVYKLKSRVLYMLDNIGKEESEE